MQYVGHRAYRADTNPLRSIPLFRPAHLAFGPTARHKAEVALFIARRDLPTCKGRYAVACAALGDANRMRGPMRRFWQAKAFRAINMARAQLRAVRKQLVSAEMTLAALAIAAA